MHNTSTSTLDHALVYAGLGFAVFPCHSVTDEGKCTCGRADCSSPGKHPMTSNGFQQATTNVDQIAEWFGGEAAPNIGIATGAVSNLYVIDIDIAKGGSFEELKAGIPPYVFETPQIKTGGGMHIYYRHHAGLRNTAGRLGKGIDTRGDGGYVIAPPSRHISGEVYDFLNAYTEPIELPEIWIRKLQQPASATNGNGAATQPAFSSENPFIVPPPSSSHLIVPQSIDHGSRNNTLTQVAGSLRRIGLSEAAIANALRVENQRICQPPLPDNEIFQIARSIGHRPAHEQLNGVSDDETAPDYENTLRPYLYSNFIEMKFEPKEILAFHIGARDIAILQAATNAGKTTLLRNVTLCMAAGRPFLPFYDGRKPIKIAYFDFENDAQDVQRDLMIMDKSLTDEELKNVKENLIVIPKGLMNGELFQFNTNEKWALELIRENSVQFVVVDNVSAAYDLNDENSNAEVTRKVIKPLLKMAYRCDCAFLFAHHYGKAKTNEIEQAGVHAGRGASALQALSRTVINMKGDVSKAELVTVECAKRKTDGGQNYREVFELREDRWFHHTTIAATPVKKTAYQVLRTYLADIQFPDTVKTSELIEKFELELEPQTIRKALVDLHKDGFVIRPKQGEYAGRPRTETARNYYEKDDD